MESKEPTIRDGFRVVKTTFGFPDNVGQLDAHAKRKATICNLFVNHRLTILDVVRILDESYRHVVTVLIERGIIEERRALRRIAKDVPGQRAFTARFQKRSSS